MIITFTFVLLCQLQISDTQFNLYYTDQSSIMNVFGHDCLYCGPDEVDFSFSKIFIPFCIRPEKVKESNDENRFCYGTSITFKQLKTNNASTDDLFHWNAVIQIIDLYEKYLRFPNLVNENEVYCNCSILQRFGKDCQYEINTEDYQRIFSELFWNSRVDILESTLENNYLTCYIGLQCQTNLFCLDWRQICNGVVDCDHGEDEPADLCLQMEINQCHPEEEFRCQNGLCIPMTMADIPMEVCPDLSDGRAVFNTDQNYLFQLCFLEQSLECDEINRGWKQFSCLNGQSISYEDLTSKIANRGKTCINNHHLRYLRKLFSTNDENQCWKAMICLTGFDYLYFHFNCSNQINIEESCPNDEYYFPSNSIVYSFVYFLYDQNTRIDWFKYSGPNSICYEKRFCPNHSFNLSTFSKNNLTCFSIDQTSFSWKSFYEYIVQLFNPCFSSSIPMNHSMFYRCHLSETFISIYRLKDKNKDCFFNEDEDENVDLCSFNTNNQFKCLTHSNQCIQQFFLADKEYDCVDGSDEYFQLFSADCNNRICGFRPWTKRTLPEMYRFEELCDYVVTRQLFSLESNETDETDCEHWPYTCHSYYTKCNRIWNCANGIDEINCEDEYYSNFIEETLDCKPNQHYCIQLSNRGDVNATCINLNQTGDGIIDCIGGTDERLTSICIEKYPMEFERRFHCMNSSLCIRPNQVCDRIVNCPFHDDELICPWLFQSNSSTFYCQNSSSRSVVRCQRPLNNLYCRMAENCWFCDLELENERGSGIPPIPMKLYPEIYQNIESNSFQTFDSNELLIPEKQTLSLVDTNSDPFLCHFGYPIKSSILNDKLYCLCSPSYYGDYCQYQSERLTVSLRLQLRYPMTRLTVFRFMIYLLNENNLILSYDQLIFHLEIFSRDETSLIYLISERTTNLSLHQRSKSKFVRIDSYIINTTNVEYISSWFFSVSFPFLPVNRLAADIRLVNQSFQVVYCKKQCGSHGKCLHYVNAKDKEYCWCDQSWFGENCQFKSSCNSTSCAPDSQCMIINEEKKQIHCICPLGKSGDQCYITYNPCFSNPCKNNGTCLPLDQRNFAYICACQDEYHGIYCTKRNTYSYISIDANITGLSAIPATVISFGNPNSAYIFHQQYRNLIKNIKLPTILKILTTFYIYGFVQLFYNFSKSDYYIISIGGQEGRSFSLNTSVISENLCPNVIEIFNQTILNEYSYLKRLKLYHLPCNHNHNLRCFFDEYRMCMCTLDHNTVCYFYNHEYGKCNYCKNDVGYLSGGFEYFQGRFA